MRRRGFTLIELLVSVSVLAVLMSLLLPSLKRARHAAKRTLCLVNMRGLEQAHWMYLTDNDGYLIQAGLAHVGETDSEAAWIKTLRKYYGNELLARSPLDRSPHWPVDQGGQGVPVPDKPGYPYRQTTYGINDFLDVELAGSVILSATGPRTYPKVGMIRSPARIVHFVYMAETGRFAGSDHPHVYQWDATFPPSKAATQVKINAHGGPKDDWKSLAPYGFLDGHAETLVFERAYRNLNRNRFDPFLLSGSYDSDPQ